MEVCRVTVPEKLVVGNRQELKDEVRIALGEGTRKFVLDFKNTLYIDSSGLGALYSIDREVVEAGGAAQLDNMSEEIMKIIQLTRVGRIFGLGCPDMDDLFKQ
jgi:anti-sigma B factor antagonist